MSFIQLQLFVILFGFVLSAANSQPIEGGGAIRKLIDITNRPNQVGVEYLRCVQNGTIAITFDDGPMPNRTQEVINALQAHNVPATFFVCGNLGRRTIDDPETQATALETVANGHSIAHHTWSHASLTSLDEASTAEEMDRLSNALTLTLGEAPTVMRPPYGAYDDEVIRIVNGQLGYKLILWSIETNDWKHPGDTAAGVAEYESALAGTIPSQTPGFITLHHDPLEGSAELASAAIEYAMSQGYRFVTLQECLGFDF